MAKPTKAERVRATYDEWVKTLNYTREQSLRNTEHANVCYVIWKISWHAWHAHELDAGQPRGGYWAEIERRVLSDRTLPDRLRAMADFIERRQPH